MSTISDHTLALLEFEAIRSEVASSCLSTEGRELIESQEISIDPEQIASRLDFQGEIRRLNEALPFPALDFPPVRENLELFSKEGSVADGLVLTAVGSFLQSAARLRSHLTRQRGDDRLPRSDRLQEFGDRLPDLSGPAERILRLFNPDGTINEERVPVLKAIRREIQNLHNDVASLTAKYLSSDRSLWQADVPTQRDGRTVLPLKSNHRGRVQGIVHEVSTSGATVFIEPLDVVEKNNQIVEQDNRYRREVHRILKELTGVVRDSIGQVEQTVEAIAYFDSMYARSRYAATHACTRAQASPRAIQLRGARHPLLGSAAVPVDFELGEQADVMIITGANAGGKTVSIKTVGLLALMNQWGLEIPAGEGSTLPVLERVLVDIGDDQSIANSLSTFSGHMRALSTIIAECNASSLVLLDEIGSGTDPSEGSALAMAAIDHLLDRGSLVVATTHHGAIKRYGFSHPRIINASVAFDTETLTPTYQLVIGVPGESHALEIASRSRIPEAILDRARSYVEEERTDLDRAVEELERHRRQLSEREAELEVLRHSIEGREQRLEAEQARVREEAERQRTQEFGELKGFVVESRRMLENLVRELREGEITREKTRQVKAFIEKAEAKLADEEQREVPKAVAPSGSAPPIEEGSEVYVGKSRRRGIAVRRLRGDKWLVTVNTLRMTVSAGELAPVTHPAERTQQSVVVTATEASESPSIELDLRGMRLEEALETVERQLDRAVLAGIGVFSVIHGKGEGVLRQGIHNLLKRSSVVAEFHFSPPEQGGYGKTIVRLGG